MTQRDEADPSAVDERVDRALSLKRAPAPLHRIQLLLNSRNLLAGYDLLSDVPTARGWLDAPDCDEAGLARLREFREALRDLLSANATGRAPSRRATQQLRSAGSAARLSVDLDDAGNPILLPPNDSQGVDRVVADAMAALASAPADELRRLKACVNPGCGWAFYDTSRSRSGTWCRMNVCGARHKMERYRSKR